MSILTRGIGVTLGLFAVLGCGRDSAKLLPVSGHVYYQGKPLAGGTIVFTPDPERGGSGPMAFAEIHTDGSFTLHTGSAFGAVAGWHRVTVAALPPPPAIAGISISREPPSLPAKYSDPELSGLLQEVKTGVANTLELRLD